ncbi:hypothetical protein DV515_00007658, partial [Chloebia gouldiae]
MRQMCTYALGSLRVTQLGLITIIPVRLSLTNENYIYMQGIKIATDLHPGNNNLITFLEETRLGISLTTRRTQAWLPHSRD